MADMPKEVWRKEVNDGKAVRVRTVSVGKDGHVIFTSLSKGPRGGWQNHPLGFTEQEWTVVAALVKSEHKKLEKDKSGTALAP